MFRFVRAFIVGVIQGFFIGYSLPVTCHICHTSGPEPEAYHSFVTLLCGHRFHPRCIRNGADGRDQESLLCPICWVYFERLRRDAAKSKSANGSYTIDMPKRRYSPPPRPSKLEMLTISRSIASPPDESEPELPEGSPDDVEPELPGDSLDGFARFVDYIHQWLWQHLGNIIASLSLRCEGLGLPTIRVRTWMLYHLRSRLIWINDTVMRASRALWILYLWISRVIRNAWLRRQRRPT